MLSDQEKKDELIRLIRESKTKGQEIAKRSSDLVQFGQNTSDLADASLGVLKYVLPKGIGEGGIKRSWEYLNQQQGAILEHMRDIVLPDATASASTAKYAMSGFASFNNISSFVPPDKRDDVKIATQKLSNVINRQAEKDKIISLLQQ